MKKLKKNWKNILLNKVVTILCIVTIILSFGWLFLNANIDRVECLKAGLIISLMFNTLMCTNVEFN